MEEESKFFIRMAQEPLWKDRGAPQTEYRTHERWAALYMQDGKYHVEFGNDRGTLGDEEFNDSAEANSRIDEMIHECGMDEDVRKEVQRENEKLTLKKLVECYFKTGDLLSEGMDEWLDRIKKEAHVPYRYRNLYSSSGGFLAQVKMWKRSNNVTDRVEIFIGDNGMGNMVLNIQNT